MFAFVACDAQNWMQWKFVWCAATTVCEWQTNKTSQLAAVCSSAAREIIIKQKTVPQYNRRRVTNACSAFALMLYAFVTGCALQFTQFLFAFHSDDVTHTVHPWLCLFLFIYVDVRRKNRKIRLSSILMIFVIVFDFFFVSFSSHTHTWCLVMFRLLVSQIDCKIRWKMLFQNAICLSELNSIKSV